MNAVFYRNKAGCQWRMLPKGFPPWQTVYYHFRCWIASGLLKGLTDALRRSARVKAGGLIWRCFCWLLHLVRREENQSGFLVQKKRWIVERTFSWMGGSRRLSKDYEHLHKSVRQWSKSALCA